MLIKKGYIGSLIVWGLALVPVVLWFMIPTSVPRWSNLTMILFSLGQLAALVGSSLFAMNLILSARLRFVEKLFAGLNRVYTQHARHGKIAFLLLLFHPLLLLSGYAGGSLEQAVLFLLPSWNWPLNFGKLALSLMSILILITLYWRPKYHIWKITHKFMGLAFFLATLHMWLIPSDIAYYKPLRYYVLGLACIGLSAYVYHTILGRWLIRRATYTVTDVTVLNNIVTQISMEPVGKSVAKPIQFTPGQFIFVSFADPIVGLESHPFSITAGPADQSLTISAKILGDYTKRLTDLTVGSPVKIEGPFGQFSYRHSKHPQQIWIAGGIGVTPFVSMAKALANDPGYTVKLYYSVKNKAEAVYLNVLRAIAETSGAETSGIKSSRFELELFCSDTQGRVDAAYISQHSPALSDSDIFLCAPPPMIQALKKQFLAQGIAKHQLYSEEFAL